MGEKKMFKARFVRSLLIVCVAASALAYTGCARSPQAKRDKYIAAGKKQMEKKDYPRAVLEFKNAIQAMPRDSESYYQLGIALAAAGDAQNAYAMLSKAVELNPNNQLASLRLAQLMASSTERDVVKLGQDQLSRMPGADSSPEILNAMALTHFKLGETGDAIQSLTKALARSPKELSSSLMLAIANISKGDYDNAEKVLRQACASNPNAPDPHVVLGEFYHSRGKNAEALNEFTVAVHLAPKNLPALFDLAQVQRVLGKTQEAELSFQQLASSGDKSYRALHALFLMQDNRTDAAIGELEKLVKADSSDRAVRTYLISAYEIANRRPDAERFLAQALKKNPHDSDALLQRAELLQAEGKFADADKDLNEVLHLNPDSAELHFARAKLDEVRGQTLSEQQELTESLRLDPKALPVRLKLVEVLRVVRDPKSALGVLEAAPGDQKRSLSWLEQRNWVLLALGDLARMRQGVDAGLKSARTPDLLLQDAMLKLRAKNVQGARAGLEQALNLDPADVAALELLAETYTLEKANQTALEKTKEYAAKQPKSARMQAFLGAMLLKNGARDQARAAFMAAKADDPHYLMADFSLVQLDLADHKVVDAQKRLQDILASDGRNPKAHLWMAVLEQDAGNQDAAMAEYRKTLEGDGQNMNALNNLAHLLTEANKPDEALPYAEKAREIHPGDPQVADTLGWIFYRKGLYTSAVKQMEDAASQKQAGATIKYHLAMAYAKSGNSRKGVDMLEAALKIDPTLPEATAAKEVVRQSK